MYLGSRFSFEMSDIVVEDGVEAVGLVFELQQSSTLCWSTL